MKFLESGSDYPLSATRKKSVLRELFDDTIWVIALGIGIAVALNLGWPESDLLESPFLNV